MKKAYSVTLAFVGGVFSNDLQLRFAQVVAVDKDHAIGRTLRATRERGDIPNSYRLAGSFANEIDIADLQRQLEE
jgi:hypothetical protein